MTITDPNSFREAPYFNSDHSWKFGTYSYELVVSNLEDA